MTDVTIVPAARRGEPPSTAVAHLPRLGTLDTARPTQGAQLSAKNDRQKLLADVPLFSACTDRELDRLARHAEVVDFVAGDVLMTEGESGHEFFAIVDGEVGVTSGGETGAQLGPRSYFGELAPLDPRPPPATVTALPATPAGVVSSRGVFPPGGGG